MGKLKDAYTAVASAVKQQVSSLLGGGKASSSASNQGASGTARSTSTRASSGSTGKTSSGTKSSAQSSQTSRSSQATSTASNGTRRSNNEYRKQQDKKNQDKSSSKKSGKTKSQKQSIYSSGSDKGSKSQGGSEDNYLADTVEDSIKNQPQNIYSGGAKNPEQQGQQIYSKQQEDADMDAAWATLEGKQASRQAAKAADAEVERLRQEGQNKSQIWEDGIYLGEDKAVADEYSRRIAEAQDKADRAWEAAGGKKESDKSLGEKLGEMAKQEDNWQSPDAWNFLAEDEQTNQLVGGWGKQYGGGVTMAAGTGLEWLDKTSDDMVRYEYDQEHGEGAYDRAIAGKNVNQIGQLGENIWNTGVKLRESGEEDWAKGTENMSDTGKAVAGVAKAGADLAADASLNLVAPGLGTMRMYMGAAGNAAYEQSQRENNDVDSRMLAMVKAGASAYLSNKLVGDVIYGKGIIPKGMDRMLEGATPEVRKAVRVLLNSEGVEEGLENIMNWAGDRILGLDTGTPLDWNEVKQDALVGYVLGVVTNGLAGGMNIDSAKRQAIANEAVEFAESGLSIEEAAEIGKQNTRDQVVMKPGAHEAGANVGTEAETRAETPATEAPQQSGLNGILNNPQGKNGQLSNSQVAQILQNPDMYQEFLAAAGLQDSDIDHSSKSAERADIRDAANRIQQQRNNQEVTDIVNEFNESRGEEVQTPTEPNADTTRRVQEIRRQANAEQRNLAPGEINQILSDPAALKAYADQTGTTVRQARAELEQLLNGGTDVGTETETAPEQPRVNDTERTPTNRFWNAVNEGPDALLHLIAEDPNNMEEYMRIFEEATGEAMSNDPDVLQDQINRITDEAAERSGKKQVQTELEAAEAELEDALQEYNETGEWTPELDNIANRVDGLRDQLGMEPYFSENGYAAGNGENTGNNNAGTEQNTSGNENTRQNSGNRNQRQNAWNQQQNSGQEQNRSNRRRRPSGGPDENTEQTFDELGAKTGTIEQGEKPARDINVPRKDTRGQKVGEGARTIFEADATPDERLPDLKAAVVNGDMGHIPVTNDARSKNAVSKLAKDGWTKSVADFLAAVNSGKVDADTIALGAHLLNEAGNAPECTGREYVELCMAYNDAVHGTGQALAAARILKTLTPEGKLYGIEKTVEKMNQKIRENNEKRGPRRQKSEIKLDEDLVEAYLNAETEEERNAIHDAIIKDAASQVPNTLRDKFVALRYLNMLGNFKTQVRNLAGNVGMGLIQKAKNEVRSGMEGAFSLLTGGKYERTYKGFYNPKLYIAAMKDINSNEDIQKIAKGEAKFSDAGKQAESEIMQAKDSFSNKNPFGWLLNKYSKATETAMDVGDVVFVRANYADALAGYLNAHKITAEEWQAMVNDPSRAAEVDKARAFAVKQAQESTFRDTNAVSKFVSDLDKGPVWNDKTRAIINGILPFRKTPANVLVRMEEYSPLGLVNTAYKAYQAKNGNATASDVIDSLAKTLTGSAITMLGYYLRGRGRVRTQEKDKGQEKLDKLAGKQDYSIEVDLPKELGGGRKSLTMDWLTPASGSFFMGAELYDLVNDGEIQWKDAVAAMFSITNPMLNMSMLSGVNDALNNLNDFQGDNSAMMQFVLNSAWSYLTQGISNTLAGQAEQFSEDYRQTYYTDSDGFFGNATQKKLAKLGNKTPGIDYQNADYIDAWGRKQANDENKGKRAWNAFFNPSYVSDLDEKATKVDGILNSLYQYGKKQKETDDFPNVIPQTPSRSTTVNGTKLTPEEYDVYATTKGQESLNAVTEFVESAQFKKMGKIQQAETIRDIYSYSEFLAASKIAESRGEKYYDEKFTPLLTGQKEDGENTYKAPIKEADIPEYLGFMNAYDAAMDKKDYNAVDALINSARSLPESARVGATQRAKDMEKLSDMKKAGLSSVKTYYQFQNDMREIYESEKRSDPKSTDYIRVAGSGKYSDKDADAIMGYERKVSEESIARYQDRVKYSLDKAGKSELYDAAWSNIEKCANGDMTTDQFNKWVEKNVPLKYRQNIKDVRSTYASDKHVAGKQVSGIYRAVREAGYTPQQALQFFNMIDKNYNDSYTKHEINTAVAKAFGYDSKYNRRYYGKTYTYYNFSGYAKKVRDGITKYAGK